MPTWNELFEQEEFRWKEPHPQVVALVPMLKERGAKRVLDLGCGAGRHLVHLARSGFEVCGTDIAENGLEHARHWLAQGGLAAELIKSDIAEIPYPDEFFDALISVFVIYHKTLAEMCQVIAEIRRVLRPGGLALVSFQSKRAWRYRHGREIERDTFVLDVGDDCGVPHHFTDLAEIESLFQGLVIRRIDLEESMEEGHRHSHWHVLAEKE